MRTQWVASGLLTLLLTAFAQGQSTDEPVDDAVPASFTAHEPAVLNAVEMVCNPCCSARRGMWFQTDYLLWWIRRGPVATPLVTTGADGGNGVTPGTLGQPNTRILYGADGLDYGAFSGLRLVGGIWLDPEETFGIEASYFGLERRSTGFRVASDADGIPILARPFVNGATGNPTALLSSLPGELTGAIDITSASRLQGWEVNFVGRAGAACPNQWIFGFRSVDLAETLQIVEGFQPLTPQPIFQGEEFGPPSVLVATDRFSTSNHFYGPQVGGRLTRDLGMFDLEVFGKMALGWTDQRARIAGATALIEQPGADPDVVPGGVLAQPTNSGVHFRQRFGFVPELGANLRMNVGERLRLQLGYTFVYWNSVLRPGAQIDPVVSDNNIPTSPFFGAPGASNRPAFDFQSTSFWTQGLNFGMALQF